MNHSYGPWSTAINSGSRPELSSFWKQRMARLALARHSKPALSRREFLGLGAAGVAACAVPTLYAATQEKAEKASPGFKGKIVLFGQLAEDNRLYLVQTMASDGSNVQTLQSFQDPVQEGRISPDGQWVAFTTGNTRSIDGTSIRATLRLLDADGAGRVATEDAVMGCWSPDGRRIAFTRYIHTKLQGEPEESSPQLLHVETRKVAPLPLQRDDWPEDWSPDGDELIITRRSSSPNLLMRVGVDGTGVVPTSEPELSSMSPRFSPDGTKIALFAFTSLYGRGPRQRRVGMVIDRAGRITAEVIDFVAKAKELGAEVMWARPCWSPDGKQLAWSCLTWEKNPSFAGGLAYGDFPLLRMNADGSNLQELRRDAGPQLQWCHIDWA